MKTEKPELSIPEQSEMHLLRVLTTQIAKTRFGKTTPEMRQSAGLIAEEGNMSFPETWIAYAAYTLHTENAPDARRYLSVNRLVLKKSLDEVVGIVLGFYRGLKVSAGNEEAMTDIRHFDEFVGKTKSEIEERETKIKTDLKMMETS